MNPDVVSQLRWRTGEDVVIYYDPNNEVPDLYSSTTERLIWEDGAWVCKDSPADESDVCYEEDYHELKDEHLLFILGKHGLPADVLPLAMVRHTSPSRLESLTTQIRELGGNRRVKEMLIHINAVGYRIERYLGGGGWGVVFEATRERDNRRLALKLLKPPYTDEWKTHFLREVAILKALTGTQRVISVEEDPIEVDNLLCLPMTFVEGRPLSELILPCNTHHALLLTCDILSALAVVHDKQIVHRDLHLGNVMLCPNGDVFILDFGLARLETVSCDSQTFRPVGAMSHCAPEKWTNPSGAGPVSDVYSVGVMLYRMLTGRNPFWADTYIELYETIKKGIYKKPSTANSKVPDFADIVVRSMLAVDPRDRPPDAVKAGELVGHAEALALEQWRYREVEIEFDPKTLLGRDSVACPKCSRSVKVARFSSGMSEHASAKCDFCGWCETASNSI